MDSEIEFGDVEEVRPEPEMRPDQNRHYCVVPCGSPADHELAVFVDVDCMRDMEYHALSDTSVELGGVLLGGQHEDDRGRPFVVVTDSLRAEHYESTKGSFKFTHDTWSQISKQRDEFPDELQMVGWYHTHPDWGVFLSGMDMFICDNFFNKTLDVALVIDPCRQDRGFFQWTGDPSERVRRTQGFYLIGSRFRQEELEYFAAHLEGSLTMARDPRYSGFSGPSPAPIVNISDQRSSWQATAMIAMLTVQFLFLALIAWRMMPAAGGEPAENTTLAPEEIALRAERDVLDEIIGRVEAAPDGLVTTLQHTRLENDQLKATNLGLHSHIKSLEKEQAVLTGRQDDQDRKIANLEASLENVRKEGAAKDGQIEALKTRLALYEEPEDAATAAVWWRDWRWITAGAVALVLVIGGAVAAFNSRRREQEEDQAIDPHTIDDER